jgi:hypothetical protein
MVFVVLEEHCQQFAIHDRITGFYPKAQIIRIADVTSGAAETAHIGLSALKSLGPVAINDCDQAFIAPEMANTTHELTGTASGALLCFRSNSPAYSYIKLGSDGAFLGTIEKQVVSPFAIAGCYLFSSPALFAGLYEEYRKTCAYQELFISGIYDLLVARGKTVLKIDAKQHIAFGTPEELGRITDEVFHSFLAWKELPNVI